MKRRLLLLALLALCASALAGCPRKRGETPPVPLFVDVTAKSGIAFTHSQYDRPRHLPDVMGPGCGWADYDGDGRDDLFLVNGSGAGRGAAPTSRLYRNLGGGAFEDVTRTAGLDVQCFGMGCNWADYDNDGFPDLFVTAFGECRLFHNEGGKRFTDVTRRAGIGGRGFYSACAWGDYDRDGLLDLYVGQSAPIDARWLAAMDRRGWPRGSLSLVVQKEYLQMAGDIDFIPGLVIFHYPEGHGTLYRNRGDGAFEDVTKKAGLALQQGRTWQPELCDLDDDGWLDLFLSNDGTPNSLHLNNRDGTFRDVSIQAYIADMHSNMGVAVGDYDGSGAMSLYIPHWYSQGNVLFRNNISRRAPGGPLTFTETADRAGLRRTSMNVVGFGPLFLDYDNDGDLDLAVVNGHTHPAKGAPGRLIPFRPFLYCNDGDGKFAEVGAAAGGFFTSELAGRGVAASDFDGDGRLDFAATTSNGPAHLVRNVCSGGNHWLAVRLVGRKSNRDAVGARVRIAAAGRVQVRDVLGGEGYLGNHAKTLHFGLGRSAAADAVTIRWPCGDVERVGRLDGDRLHVIEEGRAAAEGGTR